MADVPQIVPDGPEGIDPELLKKIQEGRGSLSSNMLAVGLGGMRLGGAVAADNTPNQVPDPALNPELMGPPEPPISPTSYSPGGNRQWGENNLVDDWKNGYLGGSDQSKPTPDRASVVNAAVPPPQPLDRRMMLAENGQAAYFTKSGKGYLPDQTPVPQMYRPGQPIRYLNGVGPTPGFGGGVVPSYDASKDKNLMRIAGRNDDNTLQLESYLGSELPLHQRNLEQIMRGSPGYRDLEHQSSPNEAWVNHYRNQAMGLQAHGMAQNQLAQDLILRQQAPGERLQLQALENASKENVERIRHQAVNTQGRWGALQAGMPFDKFRQANDIMANANARSAEQAGLAPNPVQTGVTPPSFRTNGVNTSVPSPGAATRSTGGGVNTSVPNPAPNTALEGRAPSNRPLTDAELKNKERTLAEPAQHSAIIKAGFNDKTTVLKSGETEPIAAGTAFDMGKFADQLAANPHIMNDPENMKDLLTILHKTGGITREQARLMAGQHLIKETDYQNPEFTSTYHPIPSSPGNHIQVQASRPGGLNFNPFAGRRTEYTVTGPGVPPVTIGSPPRTPGDRIGLTHSGWDRYAVPQGSVASMLTGSHPTESRTRAQALASILHGYSVLDH